jgi:hypothetical protein
MTERLGVWRVMTWRGRWTQLATCRTRSEAMAIRDQHVRNGYSPKTTLVLGLGDVLPPEPYERVTRPAGGWWTRAKFHRDQSGRS